MMPYCLNNVWGYSWPAEGSSGFYAFKKETVRFHINRTSFNEMYTIGRSYTEHVLAFFSNLTCFAVHWRCIYIYIDRGVFRANNISRDNNTNKKVNKRFPLVLTILNLLNYHTLPPEIGTVLRNSLNDQRFFQSHPYWHSVAKTVRFSDVSWFILITCSSSAAHARIVMTKYFVWHSSKLSHTPYM